MGPQSANYDLLIIGGGVNGAGIARDAAGRGLKVLLAEADDLASHTSSASTKLIHGGLRYLEHFEFRLVRESLVERERLLGVGPHIIWPLRFVLPQPPGGRPAWMIRIGLFLYDHLSSRRTLPASHAVDLSRSPLGHGLKPHVRRGFVYSDCWVDDARLVTLNAVDAAERGADVRTRTRVAALRPQEGCWTAELHDRMTGSTSEVRASIVVNAAGAGVGDVLDMAGFGTGARRLRLVKGSHIIVPRSFEGEHAFILQNPDGRIVFAIPYEDKFTLIGTTDIPWTREQGPPRIEPEEIDYLCQSVNRYLEREISARDVLHSYSGVRPLFDDGAEDVSAVTRDYVLDLQEQGGARLLSVFGGKITTYRRLAEQALEKLEPFVEVARGPWTDREPLPGGDIPDGAFDGFLRSSGARWPFLPDPLLHRLARGYGTGIEHVLGSAARIEDLGPDLGGGLHARELDYLADHEWAMTAEDVLWRRTKLGLHLPPGTAAAVDEYLGSRRRGESL